MKRLTLVMTVFAVVFAAGIASAEYVWEYAPNRKCEFGADLRLRLSHWDRDVLPPGLVSEPGPAVEYLRVRERMWGCFDVTENMQLMIRATNRWHHFSSHFRDDNNQTSPFNGPGGGVTGNTWAFPDEVVLDNLYLDITQFMGTNWHLRLGRQDLMLGNGMVVLEGTPYDQGRTIYFDGITATCDTEDETLRLFAFYNRYKDTFVFINDQNRRLRRGDTLVLGSYWTRRFKESLNTDLYYIYTDIDDDREASTEWEAVEYGHGFDENATLQVVGARLFGALDAQTEYSIEAAKQFGEMSDSADFTGELVDARLNWKAADGTTWSPVVGFQYTYMSGDDTNSADEYEGWHPMFAEYPIWREELLPIKFNGHWTNLHQFRGQVVMHLRETEKWPMTLTTAYAYLRTDDADTPQNVAPGLNAGGNGDEIGQLVSAFLDIGVSRNLSVSFEAAEFFPGDYYDDGQTAEWLRCQAVYTF